MEEHIFQAALIDAKEAFERLQEGRQQLDLQAALLDQQIALLRSKIIGLARLLDEQPDDDSPMGKFLDEIKHVGLTRAITEVLMVSGVGMTAMEIREALNRMGIDLSRYSNIQATINTILKRLSDSGRVDIGFEVTEKGAHVKGRKKRYVWSMLHPLYIPPPGQKREILKGVPISKKGSKKKKR